jgi:hypothetical protein
MQEGGNLKNPKQTPESISGGSKSQATVKEKPKLKSPESMPK